MNIFALDTCPIISAQLQCDKHVVKMIVESAQMLSTAHRMLDGTIQLAPSKSGKRMVKHYRLFDDPEYDRIITIDFLMTLSMIELYIRQFISIILVVYG